MNHKDLQNILESDYNLQIFKDAVINPMFKDKVKSLELLTRPEEKPLTATEQKIAQKVALYGRMTTHEGVDINLYEVILQDKVIIERNKVSVGGIVKNHIWGDGAAFANFVYANNADKNWRFSFISREFEFVEGKFIAKDANPKRYTYILGKNETCKTATQRFEELGKASKITIENIREAFSVEKMSKVFFETYREIHYKNLVEEITKQHKGKSIFKAETEALEEKRIRDFAKKLLGRIVFLYFIQKKGWLGVQSDGEWGEGDRNFMQNLFLHSEKDNNFYYRHLTQLFFDALNNDRRNEGDLIEINGKSLRIPFLNGGLFDKEDIDDKPIVIEARHFEALFEFFNQYNFTVYEDSKEEQLVAVDPEMLGHIFENLLEDNKDKGAFYTPKEIVHYMCQSSLIEYLTTALGEQYTVYKEIGKNQLEIFGNETKIGQLSLVEGLGEKALDKAEVEYIVKEKDVKKLTPKQLESIKTALDKVTICDPAIGSGAFPMGILLEILAIKERIAVQLNQTWNAAKEKAYIIQHNIYGVDLEKGAVDIARLRFWLSLIVDEDAPTQLPNLDYRIMQGNSLLESFEDIDLSVGKSENEASLADIGQERFTKAQAQSLSQLAHQYFDPPEGTNKADIKAQIDGMLNDFISNIVARKKRNIEQEITKLTGLVSIGAPKSNDSEGLKKQKGKQLPKLKKQLEKALNQLQAIEQQEQDLYKIRKTDEKPFFLWSLYFADVFEKGGFDVVIGNPPYVQMQKGKGKLAELYTNPKFDTYERTGDIYSLFYEKGINVLKTSGILTYITSDKWMRASYGKSLRKFFAEKSPLYLLLLGGKIFKTATVNTNILIIRNKGKDKNNLKGIQVEGLLDLTSFKESDFISMENVASGPWILLSRNAQITKNKIDSIGLPLNEISEFSINRGLITGLNEAFIINQETKESLLAKPVESEKNSIFKPILLGKDIKRYAVHWNNLWLINSHNGGKKKDAIDVEQHPKIKNHLESFEPKLSKRYDKGKTKYNLRNCAYLDSFEEEKIVWGNMATSAQFAFAPAGMYINAPSPMITPAKKYLLAILNSKLSDYYIRLLGVERAGGYFEYKPMFVGKLPIPEVDKKTEELLGRLVDYIKVIRQSKSPNLGSEFVDNDYLALQFEEVIDALVFELYFPKDFQKVNIDIAQYVEQCFPPLEDEMTTEEKEKIISKAYQELRKPENKIRNNMKRMTIDLEDLLMPILSV